MSCNRAGSIPTAQSLRRQDTLESWRTSVVKPQERVDEPSPKPPAVVMNSGVQPMVFNHCQVTIVQAAERWWWGIFIDHKFWIERRSRNIQAPKYQPWVFLYICCLNISWTRIPDLSGMGNHFRTSKGVKEKELGIFSTMSEALGTNSVPSKLTKCWK